MLPVRLKTTIAALGLPLLLQSCGQPSPRQNAEDGGNGAASGPPIIQIPAIPLPAPPLDREQLLIAAMQAASNYATGVNDSAVQQQLAGKKFEFRIRFGCGRQGEAGPFSWTYDPETRVLKLRAAPDMAPNDPLITAVAANGNFEGAEGFWIRRPWILDAACPRTAAKANPGQPSSAAATAAQTTAGSKISQPPAQNRVGIAQLFTRDEPRALERDGRAYQLTKKLDEGDDPMGGFDLILSGRLTPLPEKRVIACSGGDAETSPQCLISASFDKVRIERADTNDMLAEWSAG